VIAQFYFWNAGDTLQKSQEGLLRSVIFEILSQCPYLIPTACDAVDGFSKFDRGSKSWDLEALLLMFDAIMGGDIPVKFCLLIDGLDEFAELKRTHIDLLMALRRPSHSQNIKILVSSRLWTVFDDEFRNEANWHLKLEDVTRNDIKRCVVDKFSAHTQFQVLTSQDPALSIHPFGR
jgi:hypothetical protein